jgi:3-oxoacyl-[acyl-carrier protein] reductase
MRNVIVTGGSRGLGLSIAQKLAGNGFHAIAVARKTTDGFEAAAADHKGAMTFMSCDLADLAALPVLVKRVRSEIGPIYGLVNNAGLGTSGVLSNMHVTQIEALVRLNTVSPMVLTKHAVRSMMTGNGGRIVNISSIIASTGYSGLSVYAATKASMVGFTKSLAREVGQFGITVNAVAPGFVETAMTADMGDGDRAKIAGRSALRRMPGADDVAESVAFLVSDAAKNITGTVLTVDAGNTA